VLEGERGYGIEGCEAIYGLLIPHSEFVPAAVR